MLIYVNAAFLSYHTVHHR